MNKETLIEYLNILNACFYVDDEIPSSTYERYQMLDKSYLSTAILDKEKYHPSWKNFLVDIKTNFSGHVRDMNHTGPRHAFNGIFSYGNPLMGIDFSISIPFKLYGFYFAKFNESGLSLSYSPFDEDLGSYREKIERLIKKYFPDFTLFHQNLSEFKIKLVTIDDRVFKDIDLWKVVFSPDEWGII